MEQQQQQQQLRRSPYSTNTGPFRVRLLHATRRVVVDGWDYGVVGAPYPERRIVVSNETGWEEAGMFIADVGFPRKIRVNVGRWTDVTGFEVGPPRAVYPDRKTVLFRWDAMEVGYTDDASREFRCIDTFDCALPFGGLEKEDLVMSHTNLSADAWRAMKDVCNPDGNAMVLSSRIVNFQNM